MNITFDQSTFEVTKFEIGNGKSGVFKVSFAIPAKPLGNAPGLSKLTAIAMGRHSLVDIAGNQFHVRIDDFKAERREGHCTASECRVGYIASMTITRCE